MARITPTLDADAIVATFVDWAPPAVRVSADGYGDLPTRYRVRTTDGRTRRVYVTHFANGGGTPWVKVAGRQTYLTPQAEGLVSA